MRACLLTLKWGTGMPQNMLLCLQSYIGRSHRVDGIWWSGSLSSLFSFRRGAAAAVYWREPELRGSGEVQISCPRSLVGSKSRGSTVHDKRVWPHASDSRPSEILLQLNSPRTHFFSSFLISSLWTLWSHLLGLATRKTQPVARHGFSP